MSAPCREVVHYEAAQKTKRDIEKRHEEHAGVFVHACILSHFAALR